MVCSFHLRWVKPFARFTTPHVVVRSESIFRDLPPEGKEERQNFLSYSEGRAGVGWVCGVVVGQSKKAALRRKSKKRTALTVPRWSPTLVLSEPDEA